MCDFSADHMTPMGTSRSKQHHPYGFIVSLFLAPVKILKRSTHLFTLGTIHQRSFFLCQSKCIPDNCGSLVLV